MSYRILTVADYAAAYRGNFIESLSALEQAVLADGGIFLWVFPARAKRRDWVQEMQKAGKPVWFLTGNTMRDARLLRRLMRQYRIRIVHSHFITRKIYVPLRIASAGLPVRHVAHLHSYLRKTNRKAVDAVKHFLRHAAVNICVSDALCSAMTAAGFHPCVSVPNSIDFDRLDQYETLNRADYGIRDDQTTLMMFGYDFYIKGVDIVLTALDRYDESHRCVLLLCPAAHMEEAKQQLIARYGEFPSFVRLMPPRNDIATYYHFADIFVSASRSEGGPYAVQEAAYCRRPLVISDIETQRRVAVPHSLLYPTDDPAALFETLRRAETHYTPQKLEEAADYIRRTFALDVWVKKIFDVYDSVM